LFKLNIFFSLHLNVVLIEPLYKLRLVGLEKDFRSKSEETKLLDDLQQVDFCVQFDSGLCEQPIFSRQFAATATGFGFPELPP